MAYENELTPASIAAAAQRIKGRVLRTPLEHSEALSETSGTTAYLKLENLQRTGSFKIRGALNRLMTLSASERAAGVVAASRPEREDAECHAGRRRRRFGGQPRAWRSRSRQAIGCTRDVDGAKNWLARQDCCAAPLPGRACRIAGGRR